MAKRKPPDEVPPDVSVLVGMEPDEIVKKYGLSMLERAMEAESKGNIKPGDMPFDDAVRREKSLDSPAYLATELLDPWYKKHFEPIHYRLMDEVLGPYLLGETVRIEGSNYDPKDYSGLMVLQSRSTIKSTILRIMSQWISVYRKLRLSEDARIMFCHQVLEKAVEHSEALRETARRHLP